MSLTLSNRLLWPQSPGGSHTEKCNVLEKYQWVHLIRLLSFFFFWSIHDRTWMCIQSGADFSFLVFSVSHALHCSVLHNSRRHYCILWGCTVLLRLKRTACFQISLGNWDNCHITLSSLIVQLYVQVTTFALMKKVLFLLHFECGLKKKKN